MAGHLKLLNFGEVDRDQNEPCRVQTSQLCCHQLICLPVVLRTGLPAHASDHSDEPRARNSHSATVPLGLIGSWKLKRVLGSPPDSRARHCSGAKQPGMDVTGEPHGKSGAADPGLQLINPLVDLAPSSSSDPLEVMRLDRAVLRLRPRSNNAPIDPQARAAIAGAVEYLHRRAREVPVALLPSHDRRVKTR